MCDLRAFGARAAELVDQRVVPIAIGCSFKPETRAAEVGAIVEIACVRRVGAPIVRRYGIVLLVMALYYLRLLAPSVMDWLSERADAALGGGQRVDGG